MRCLLSLLVVLTALIRSFPPSALAGRRRAHRPNILWLTWRGTSVRTWGAYGDRYRHDARTLDRPSRPGRLRYPQRLVERAGLCPPRAPALSPDLLTRLSTGAEHMRSMVKLPGVDEDASAVLCARRATYCTKQ